jgi:glycogen debranching enzyme
VTDPATSLLARAYRIAVRDLRACYNPDGIVAGRLHFNAYWARDGFWACLGALALGDADQVRAHLETFVRFQRRSGEVPVRIEFVGHTFGHYHTRRAHPRALFRAGSVFADPLDPTALFIVTARAYAQVSGDVDFCGRCEASMDRAVAWLAARDHDGDGLVENGYLAGWMDSVLKKDKVFYLNVVYLEGLRACAEVKQWLGHSQDAQRLRQQADRVARRLREVFWTGEYFADWVRGHRRGGFSSDGHVLAILWGIADAEESRRILDTIRRRGLEAQTPLRTCDPPYRPWQIFPFYYLAGIPDYHSTLIWPWLGTLHAVNVARLGDRPRAVSILVRIGAWYVAHNAVAEVYEPDGRPVARRFFQAEVPFAWHAGVYVYALHALGLVPGVSGDRSPTL